MNGEQGQKIIVNKAFNKETLYCHLYSLWLSMALIFLYGPRQKVRGFTTLCVF